MNYIVRLLFTKVFEAVYFSIFLIIGKNLKNKRILLTLIMIFEYLLLKCFIKYNVLFQIIYTFMSYINLKVLYKDKAQIIDIFLFNTASISIIILNALVYLLVYITLNNYFVGLCICRIVETLFLILCRNKIPKIYKDFYSLWNRHNIPDKPKSLTIRNISIVIFNVTFWIINLGMIFFLKYLK